MNAANTPNYDRISYEIFFFTVYSELDNNNILTGYYKTHQK